jgi:hypothetical protein
MFSIWRRRIVPEGIVETSRTVQFPIERLFHMPPIKQAGQDVVNARPAWMASRRWNG